MDRAEVEDWLRKTFDVSRETLDKLALYADLLIAENKNQNLIAPSTVSIFWDRHIRDSAQLLCLAPQSGQKTKWLDLGSGPGLPGLVIALIADIRITLVEARRRRMEFLHEAVARLDLADTVTVEGARLETLDADAFDVITGRAFAPLPKLFDLAHRFAHPDTLWILLKGKSVDTELAVAKAAWQGEFETIPSVTDPDSFIIVARNIEPRRDK